MRPLVEVQRNDLLLASSLQPQQYSNLQGSVRILARKGGNHPRWASRDKQEAWTRALIAVARTKSLETNDPSPPRAALCKPINYHVNRGCDWISAPTWWS